MPEEIGVEDLTLCRSLYGLRNARRDRVVHVAGEIIVQTSIDGRPARKVWITWASGDRTVMLAMRRASREPQRSSIPIKCAGLRVAAMTAVLRRAPVNSMKFWMPRSSVRTLPARVPLE